MLVEHGFWIHVYTVRPKLRYDWSPMWAPLLPPRHVDAFRVGRDIAARGRISWECRTVEYPRVLASGCEAMLALEPWGSMFCITTFGGKMQAYDGTFTLDWGERPVLRGQEPAPPPPEVDVLGWYGLIGEEPTL